VHIPDGFLSPAVTGLTDAAGLAIWGASVRKLPFDVEQIPRWGMAGALLFAVEIFSFPVPGGTSVHLSGIPMVTLIFGPVPALFLSGIVLFLQAVLFGHGGILTWGANFLNMGILGVGLTWWGVRLGRRVFPEAVAVGFATGIAILLGAMAAAVELGLSGTLPLPHTLLVMILATLPLSVVEGLLTTFGVQMLRRLPSFQSS